MLVNAYNAIECEDKDVIKEVIAINNICYSIEELRLTIVSSIHITDRLYKRIVQLVEKDYFYGESVRDIIEINNGKMYFKRKGYHIKVQCKYGGAVSPRPWWITVSPIKNKGDRCFR